MLKKSTYFIVSILVLIVGTSAVLYSPRPPQGYTGAPGGFGTCGNAGCHNSFPVNSGGGNISVSGLPTVYTPGMKYTFSLTISHGAADRKRWGFSIAARKSSDPAMAIGTFSSSNDTASLNGSELSHGNGSTLSAPVTVAQMSYTFTKLEWTAPAAGSGAVTFYFAGNAADDINGSLGDYIYTASTMSAPLPITLYSFSTTVKNSSVLLSWQTTQEINSDHFVIQKSTDNSQFNDIGKVGAAGNSSLAKNYSFTDDNPASFEKPIFYRLEMVDKDGSKTYSKIENVVLKATSTYIKSIYPNPLKSGNILHINLVSKENEMIFLKLIDNNGRIIKSMEMNAEKGSNILNVNMPVSSTGNYKLMIKSSAGIAHESLLIR